MKKLFTLLAIVFCLNANAQTWMVIPDAHFVTYLHTIVPAAMHGDSLDTSSTLVTTTTHYINVNNKTISNLTGVQYFTSLTYLDCGNNQLTSLPTLPNSLKYFNCKSNSLSNLPALPNSITYLDCNSNSLTSLPVLSAVLDTLLCGANHLTSLPVLPNSLVNLYCTSNSLTTLPVLPNSIQTLSCDANSLTNLPALPNSLIILTCALNHFANLPALPNSLGYLDCQNDFLTNLPSLPNSLRELICNNNSLTSLPTLPDSLLDLDCSYNQIQCLPYIPPTIPMGGLYLQVNSFNCLLNYTHAMGSDTVTYPLCAAGNSHGCAVAGITTFNTQASTFQLYPNPTQNNFTIEVLSNEKQILQVYDVNGKQVLSQTINSTINIDVSNFNAGVYNINISGSVGIINKRLVIVR